MGVVVTDRFEIKGRGTAVCIDALPEGLDVGSILKCGDRTWEVVGRESWLMGPESDIGRPSMLLLRGETPAPAIGEELSFSPKEER